MQPEALRNDALVAARSGAAQGGQTVSVAPHQRNQLACAPVTGDVALWIGEAAQQPAEVEPVSPHRNIHLVAAEEGDGGADAVDGGPVCEMLLEIQAEALLRPAAD